jgi:hypothetical protein
MLDECVRIVNIQLVVKLRKLEVCEIRTYLFYRSGAVFQGKIECPEKIRAWMFASQLTAFSFARAKQSPFSEFLWNFSL